MKTLAMTTGALIATILAGCAAAPPPELKSARATFQSVAQSPAASIAPADVYEAKKALGRAELVFEDDGDSQEARDLAYVAERKAIIAKARANAVSSATKKRAALAELDTWKEGRAEATLAQLGMAEKKLTQTEAQLESERQARVAAEQRTADALAAVKGMSAKQDPRGLVVTISGAVLFQTGKSELMPTARRRLAEVIQAVKEDGRPIMIVGHTDSVGSDENNQLLSQRRAEAVRGYMMTQGIPADRIRAQGMGETIPVANNLSAEGRANNRRVEIVLEGSATDKPAMPGTGEPSGKDKGKAGEPKPGSGELK